MPPCATSFLHTMRVIIKHTGPPFQMLNAGKMLQRICNDTVGTQKPQTRIRTCTRRRAYLICSHMHNQFDIFSSWHNFCLDKPQCPLILSISSFHNFSSKLLLLMHLMPLMQVCDSMSLPKATRFFCDQMQILNCCVYLKTCSLTCCACPVGIPVQKQVSATFQQESI